MEELIKISSAVNLNIGTLDLDFIKRCESAAEIAKKCKKPVIPDPVGAGAAHIRIRVAG
ncbi:MAG: hypothetical protein IRD7MM_01945 [Candidatus Midichloria mitochondrii]|uniref:hydroxyethylthiazole kinase n=1 Tax=Candidatus Midichloria mitochondrii TaxID=234827 RepID=UPI0002F95032|nr:hydroxyethylthiazole kinase [Candidatus Midichloria mitochondrii]